MCGVHDWSWSTVPKQTEMVQEAMEGNDEWGFVAQKQTPNSMCGGRLGPTRGMVTGGQASRMVWERHRQRQEGGQDRHEKPATRFWGHRTKLHAPRNSIGQGWEAPGGLSNVYPLCLSALRSLKSKQCIWHIFHNCFANTIHPYSHVNDVKLIMENNPHSDVSYANTFIYELS